VRNIDTINNVVLFDGVCNLCNTSVDFLVRNEKGNALLFASLQSEVGQKLIERGEHKEVPDSILFYKDGVLYDRSNAVLRVSQFLRFPFRLSSIFFIIPRPLRDLVYQWIARNRYKWFGKKETCRIPTAAEKGKFLG